MSIEKYSKYITLHEQKSKTIGLRSIEEALSVSIRHRDEAGADVDPTADKHYTFKVGDKKGKIMFRGVDEMDNRKDAEKATGAALKKHHSDLSDEEHAAVKNKIVDHLIKHHIGS